jgi:hypothetical protein
MSCEDLLNEAADALDKAAEATRKLIAHELSKMGFCEAEIAEELVRYEERFTTLVVNELPKHELRELLKVKISGTETPPPPRGRPLTLVS